MDGVLLKRGNLNTETDALREENVKTQREMPLTSQGWSKTIKS